MWIPKGKWAGAIMVFVIVCFMFADCANESKNEKTETEAASAASEADDLNEAETADDASDESLQVDDGTISDEETAQMLPIAPQTPTENPSQSANAAVAPQSSVPAPTPAPAPAPPKYSVVAPDGVTYTGYEPVFVICRCGEQFGTGDEWQAHRDCHSAFRCSCGAAFSGVGEWEAHTGIYDPATYLYTGKTREQSSAEGHTLTNESGHAEEYNAHNGWRTTGFPAF